MPNSLQEKMTGGIQMDLILTPIHMGSPEHDSCVDTINSWGP